MLQIIFLAKKVKISFIKEEKNCNIIEQVIQANLKDNYYSKLCNVSKTSYSLEKIILHHFFNILVNSKNCI